MTLVCPRNSDARQDDYVYDKAGQLRGQGDGCELPSGVPDGDCDQTWTYDGTGNRTESTAGATTTTYFPNKANQVTQAEIAGGNTTTFSYNWAGDRLTRDEVDSEDDPVDSLDYTWGPTGRITDILGDNYYFGEYQQHYTDDATGSLIKAEYDSDNDNEVDATFELVWDQTMPVPQIVDGIYQATVHFTQGYGLRRIAQATTTAGTFYSYDWTNSTIKSTGFPDSPTDYSAYGEQVGLGALAPFFGYRGEFAIGAGLHLRNRDYDPTTGTFLTRDPLDGADGTPTVSNAYHYVDNDPLNKTDPLGLRPVNDGDLGVCDLNNFEDLTLSQIEDPCSLFHLGTGSAGYALLGADPATFRCWRFKIDTGIPPNIDLACRVYVSRFATGQMRDLYASQPDERSFLSLLCDTEMEGESFGHAIDGILDSFDRLKGFPTSCTDYLLEVDGDIGTSLSAAADTDECVVLNLYVKSQYDAGRPDDHDIIDGRPAEVYGIEGAGTPFGSWVAAVEHFWSASATTPFCHDT